MSTDTPDIVSVPAPARIGDYLLNHPDFQRALKPATGTLAVAAMKVLVQHPLVRERVAAVAPDLSNVKKMIELLLGMLADEGTGLRRP